VLGGFVTGLWISRGEAEVTERQIANALVEVADLWADEAGVLARLIIEQEETFIGASSSDDSHLRRIEPALRGLGLMVREV
jgi:hypothetical protein